MSEIDVLVDTTQKLKEARSLAETCSDRALLYFIDMAIFQACETLASTPILESRAIGSHRDFAQASP